jgi:circadian clock protein KaiC
VSNSHTALEGQRDTPASPRASSGIAGLDSMIEGGFPAGRSVLVCGAPGTGKTTLGMQFLAAGLSADVPGILVSVDQKPRHVVEDAARFGWDFDAAMSRQTLAVLDPAPYFTAAREPARRVEVRQLTADLARRTKELRAGRLVVDSLASLLPSGLPLESAREFLRTLVFAIEDNLGCTTLFTWSEAGDGAPSARPGQAEAETLSSGVLDLKLVRTKEGRHERRLFVRKMRGTVTDLTERPFTIHPGRGLVVATGPR